MTPEEWRMTPNKVGRTVYMPKLSYHGSREVTIQSVFKDTAIVKWQEIKVRHGGKGDHWKKVFTAFQPCQTFSWENPAKGGRRK